MAVCCNNHSFTTKLLPGKLAITAQILKYLQIVELGRNFTQEFYAQVILFLRVANN